MLKERDIGGAYVRRLFTRGKETLTAGRNLSREEVLAIPPVNRRALIDQGKLELYPLAPRLEDGAAVKVIAPGEKKGTYNVIAGRIINTAPLTRDEAEELATKPN